LGHRILIGRIEKGGRIKWGSLNEKMTELYFWPELSGLNNKVAVLTG